MLARIEVPELLASRAKQQAELKAAEAEYGRLEESLHRAPDLVVPQMVDQARGRMEVARANLDQSETMLSYSTVTAPFAGIVTQRLVDPGEIVTESLTGPRALYVALTRATQRLTVVTTDPAWPGA